MLVAQAKRFEKPQPAEPWSGIYDATKYRDQCPQPVVLPQTLNGTAVQTTTTSEDCLYLNIWRPAEESKGANRSVMVFIHGGTYLMGTIFSLTMDGRYMAHRGDVVLVTIAYRLGALGLITGGDVPVNLAIHDQIFALKWIQDNIYRLGDDPAKVTIFGESSGSNNIGHLILSPLAQGLFHRAIMQSGSPYSYYGILSKSVSEEKTKTFAKRMHCPVGNFNQTMKCFREKGIDDFVNATLQFVAAHEQPFLPVYGENEVLPRSPAEALNSGQFNRNVDLMYGVTNDEGAHFAIMMAPEFLNPNFKVTLEFVKEKIVTSMKQFNQSLAHEIVDFYTAHLVNPTQDDLK